MKKIIIGSACKALGQAISRKLNIKPSSAQMSRFADGEVNVKVESNLRNQEVNIIQSISPPVNDNLVELLLTIDAVKWSGAKRITAIIPYLGYSRQDRVIQDSNIQSALGAKLLPNLIQISGANSVAVFDLHSSQIQGFFDVPVTNLSCSELFVDSLPDYGLLPPEDLAIVAPDVGAIGRVQAFVETLEDKHKIELRSKIIVLSKYRVKAGISHVTSLMGEVANKNCVIVDDIVDSAETLCNAALLLKSFRAKSVISFVTHGVLSGNAIETISSSSLDKLVITDTIHQDLEKGGKIEVISVADILTNFIQKGGNAS